MPGRPRQKQGELKAQWATLKGESPDVCYFWGKDIPKSDAHLLHNFLYYAKAFDGKSFMEELESRGYDKKTLKIVVRLKPDVCGQNADTDHPDQERA